MTDRRNRILEKAFELYLSRGYAGVSVSVLAEELGMGRATLYYYFADKDELFRAVVQKYYLDPRVESLRVPDEVSLAELITLCMKQLEERRALLSGLKLNIGLSNLTSLFLFMMVRFPEIGDLAAKLRKQEFDLWQRALANSIRQHAVREDVDAGVMATLFMGVKDSCEAECYGRTYEGGTPMRSFGYLYDLIKV